MSIDTSSVDPDGNLDVELAVRGSESDMVSLAPIRARVRLSPAFASWALAVGACLHVFQARSVFFADGRAVWDASASAGIETELQVTPHGLMWWGRFRGDRLLFHTVRVSMEELSQLAARAEPQAVADRSYLQSTTTERVRDCLGALLRSLAVATPVIPP